MAGRRPGGLEEAEAAFLPPQAMIPPAAAMEDDDEEARFWSAMHDEEEQQQPSSASGPSLPRLSLPRFTQLRGTDEEAPSPGSSFMPPAVGPSTSSHSSSASTSTSSTSGSGGNGGQRRRSQQGTSIGVGGLAGLKQGVGELLRAIAGSAGGIVYHAEASEGGRKGRGRSHPRSSPSAMMGGPLSSSSYLELNRHAGDGFHYQRMEGEGDGEDSPLRREDEEDEEDGVSGNKLRAMPSDRDGSESPPIHAPTTHPHRRRGAGGRLWRTWTCSSRPCTGTTSPRASTPS